LPGGAGDRGKIQVTRDGAGFPFRWESRNQDDFIVVDTDFGKHVLEIGLLKADNYLRPIE
jgi:hypothetical protein